MVEGLCVMSLVDATTQRAAPSKRSSGCENDAAVTIAVQNLTTAIMVKPSWNQHRRLTVFYSLLVITMESQHSREIKKISASDSVLGEICMDTVLSPPHLASERVAREI
jgi:hypothetical protein